MPSRSEPSTSLPAAAVAAGKAARRQRPPAPPLRARLSPQVFVRCGLVVLGSVLGGSLLTMVWREPDPGGFANDLSSPAALAEKPSRAITVLVIGLDAESLGEGANQAAPPGRANADALMLVRVNAKGPLQVLNLPIEAAVNLPGSPQPVALGSVYREGGVALTAEVARELAGLEPPRPDRYLVVPRAALRRIVDTVGGLELSPPQVMQYRDKAQKYSIDLQSGLQRLDGRQVEQLVRFRDRGLGESGRRRDHQLVQSGLRDRFRRPDQLLLLPDLLRNLQGQVETNLSARESLSLLAAGLDDKRPIQFTSLPLRPPPQPEADPTADDLKASDVKPRPSPLAGLWQLEPPTPGRPIWPAP